MGSAHEPDSLLDARARHQQAVSVALEVPRHPPEDRNQHVQGDPRPHGRARRIRGQHPRDVRRPRAGTPRSAPRRGRRQATVQDRSRAAGDRHGRQHQTLEGTRGARSGDVGGPSEVSTRRVPHRGRHRPGRQAVRGARSGSRSPDRSDRHGPVHRLPGERAGLSQRHGRRRPCLDRARAVRHGGARSDGSQEARCRVSRRRRSRDGRGRRDRLHVPSGRFERISWSADRAAQRPCAGEANGRARTRARPEALQCAFVRQGRRGTVPTEFLGRLQLPRLCRRRRLASSEQGIVGPA